nr:hypothetical protein [Tanacetum cinerariifolium]
MSSNDEVTYSEGKFHLMMAHSPGRYVRTDFVMSDAKISHEKSGSRTLDFSLANGSEDEVSLSHTAVHTDYSQAKERTVKIDDTRSRKGWNFPVDGGEKCKNGVERKNGSFWCQACEKAVDYLVMRFWLELYVFDKTASTVMVMFDGPAKELLKCSADSLATADNESGFGNADHAGLPLTLANIISTTHTLEMKSHTYYKHATFESFTYWRIAPEEVVDVDSESSNMNTYAEVNITKVKRLATKPSIATSSKLTEEKGKREELEDSDDEVTGDMDDGGVDGKESSLTDIRKKKRILSNSNMSRKSAQNMSSNAEVTYSKGKVHPSDDGSQPMSRMCTPLRDVMQARISSCPMRMYVTYFLHVPPFSLILDIDLHKDDTVKWYPDTNAEITVGVPMSPPLSIDVKYTNNNKRRMTKLPSDERGDGIRTPTVISTLVSRYHLTVSSLATTAVALRDL